ncbi:MAG TPA: hypothetical protein PKY19_00535 [Oscillospiraceae bacterium]|nr:hypothetical protein [Oscillospiraceae bacterium]HXK76961.1 hypothetical protein [Oscillospiraceae bacterium]
MVKAVTRFDAIEFLNEFQRNHDNQAKARSRKVSALRSFYKYLNVSAEKIVEDPIVLLKACLFEQHLADIKMFCVLDKKCY